MVRTGRGLFPIRLPSQREGWISGSWHGYTIIEGPAWATDEDDGNLILIDELGVDIVLENYL